MPILLIGLTPRSRRQFLWLPQACKFLNDMRCKFMYIISERLHPRLQKHILPPDFGICESCRRVVFPVHFSHSATFPFLRIF